VYIEIIRDDNYISCYKSVSRDILSANEASSICAAGAPLADFCIPDSIRSNCQSGGLNIGMYFGQAFEWLQVFPREQILFLQSESFYENTTATMEEVQKFLQILFM